MKCFVYIIESQLDKSYYIGSTVNLDRRLEKHNDGMSKYTSRKIPWKLVYYEELENFSKARKREYFLKKQKNKDFYSRLIRNFKNHL